ncbi:hypothetical protein C0991_004075 [Blastosporella zonata]|nr:hypothetical protein C0991_004075 [Blastosporella zonata]
MRTIPRPSTSGAVIFYGVTKSKSKSKSGSKRQRYISTSRSDSTSNVPPGSFNSIPLPSLKPVPEHSDSTYKSISPAISTSFGEASSSVAFSGVLTLAQDIALLFANVPYIQVVASLVERIIQIANDTRVNKDRTRELMEKIMIYAGVIFDALNEVKTERGLSDLKSDLLHIASGGLTARQLKSSIALRTKSDQVVAKEMAPTKVRDILVSDLPSTRLRSKPRVFGRDKEIEEIVRIIQQASPARVAILGSGGIGKTSLALCVLHDEKISAQFQNKRVFLSCEAAQSADHIVHDLTLALQIPLNSYSGNQLDILLEHLGKAPHLITLDNLETPWELPASRIGVENLLRDLTDIKMVTLVVTIRGSQRPSSVEWTQFLPPLQPVTLDAAVDIFEGISRKGDEFAVKLIKAVDCVPLAVTLLANLAAVDGETTDVLWRRWCDESVAMVENGDDRLNNLEISIEISLSSPRIRRDTDALELLSLLSLLPDAISNETIHTLENGIPGITYVKKSLSTLIQNALITKDGLGRIRILSPIRLHMHARHPPSPTSRRFLQDHFLTLVNDASTIDELPIQSRVRAEYGNIEAIFLDCLEAPLGRNLEDVVEAILGFCQQAYLSGISSTHAISRAAIKLESHTLLTVNLPQAVSNPRKRAVARLTGFRLLGNSPKAVSLVTHNEQALKYVDGIVKLRGDCSGCLGQLLSRQGRLEEAEESLLLAIKLHVQAGDVAGHAYDLNNLGCLLSRNSDTVRRAKTSFKEALGLHEQIGDGVGAAYDLMGLGQLRLQRTKFHAAEARFTRALKLFIDNNDNIGRCAALNSLGVTVLSYSRPSDAEHHFLHALELNSGKDDVVGYADSLAGLASTLLLRSRFLEAKEKVEEAISLRSPTENPDYLHLLGRINVALYNFEAATELFLRAQVLHLQICDKRGSAEDMRYLIEIDFYLGRLLEDFEIHGGLETLSYRLDRRLRQYRHEPATETLFAVICLYTYDPIGGRRVLECSIEPDLKALELGFHHHHLGCLDLRLESYNEAEQHFKKALGFHEEAENIQGQADDHNKLSEICLRRGLFQEALTGISSRALKLHSQIGDIGGQGDDLYVQACVFLELGRLEEAEETIRQALEFHTRSSMVRGQGLDLATLSSILWQKYLAIDVEGVASAINIPMAALKALENAAEMFVRVVAVSELWQCQLQYKVMLEHDSGMTSTSKVLLISVEDWWGYDSE